MNEKILVCVTVQQGCVRLIRAGSDLALKTGAELHVLHVSENKSLLGSGESAEILNTLMSLAREAEAEMTILQDRDVVGAIARHAGQLGAATLILGPNRTGLKERLKAVLPEGIELITIDD
ncbi:MAG: universal stress protein [Clostridia bacterium]|nr:universal stress protein [Clostridia bacterium]